MKKILILLSLLIPSISWTQTKGKTENVILITLDGYRWQELFKGVDSVLMNDKKSVENVEELNNMFWAEGSTSRREKLMPFFWTVISKEGQLYGNRSLENKVNVSNDFWFSYPGYNEILVGYKDERIKSNDKIDNPNKTVLEFLNNQKDLKGKVAAFGSWDVFPFIINEKRSGIPVNAGYAPVLGSNLNEFERNMNVLQSQVPTLWPSVRFDAFTHHFALEYLKKNKPKVLFISFGETDDFAHEGRYENYLRSAHQTDAFIKELWEWCQADLQYKNKTTFIITTDHGRGEEPKENWRHHGKKIPNSDEIWFAAIGPDTKARGEVKDKGQYYQNQFAGTVSALLGYNYQGEREVGKPVKEVLK